ncbi:hypothetical protein B0H17DRAFT_969783, partial [Mycena rosella]
QTWSPNERKWPKRHKEMLKCAKKYGVEFDTFNPSRGIQGQLPLWHHFGENEDKTQVNNSKACKCLRANHGVKTVQDGLEIMKRLTNAEHKRSPACRCLACSEDRRVRNCENPQACIKAVENRLSSLVPKWDPRQPQRQSPEPSNNASSEAFVAPPPITSLTEGFRVLTRTLNQEPRDPQPPQPRDIPLDQDAPIKLFVGSATRRSNAGKLTAGGGLWRNDNRDGHAVLRLPDEQPQTALNAEAASALVGLRRAPQTQAVELTISKKALHRALTTRLQALEDRGWIGIAEREPLRALAAELKARTAPTFFREGDREIGCEKAAQLARQGCSEQDKVAVSKTSKIVFEVQQSLQLRGAKLSSLTQATAYAGIKELKASVTRKASDNSVKQITIASQLNFNSLPSPAQVWKSIRHKDFTRQVRNLLWKSLHSAHRIGSFWKHIPECEARGICQFCNETEDLEHILLKCKRPGQAQIWALAKDLWLRKHTSWPELSIGGALGCGLAAFTDEKGRALPGTSRFYRILISESIFIIWKIRNESVISKGGEPLPTNMIHNKWVHSINQRLLFDRILTNHAKYGKQNSINKSLVLQTWSATLLDEEDLPDDWIKEPRVLVGTEPKSSHPPSQPSGRRGRGQ